MAISKFPNEVWDGLTPDRPYKTLNRPADQTDYEQLVAEIQAVQKYLIDNPITIGGSSGGNFILMGMSGGS